MRLTCPNCDAKYEVPDEVIPEDGRDVQCSNCGQTWFQDHPDNLAAQEAGADPDLPDDDEEVAAPPPPPPPQPERRQLDPAVADILREEAEAEYEARRQRQAGGLETQPDLGLTGAAAYDDDDEDEFEADEAEQRAEEAKRRMARMRGEPDPVPVPGRRRELLPDIEEINSTLRRETSREGSDADVHGDVDGAHEARKSSGFRRGFLLMVLLFVVLAAVYINADGIAEGIPALAGPLSAYVSWVDQMRLLLDVQLQNLLTFLDGVSGGE